MFATRWKSRWYVSRWATVVRLQRGKAVRRRNRRMLQLLTRLALACFVLAPLSSWVPVAADDAKAIRVRVLTYNIHHGEGIDGKLDLDRIAKIISSVEPDLVSVQEVDQKVERTGRSTSRRSWLGLPSSRVHLEETSAFRAATTETWC